MIRIEGQYINPSQVVRVELSDTPHRDAAPGPVSDWYYFTIHFSNGHTINARYDTPEQAGVEFSAFIRMMEEAGC